MYSFESRVRYSEVDESGRLTMVSMVDYLQDCSTFQSEDLGIGIEHMRDVHMVWLLANWEIEVEALPRLGDHIKVSTWSYAIDKLYGCRNYTIEDASGRMLVRAESLWFLYDTERNRPVKVPMEEAAPYLSQAEERLDMPPLERRIRVEGQGREMRPITVTERHLDTNHHVNNAQYVAMAIDAVSGGFETGMIEVQYKAAARLADVIVPVVYDIDDGCIVDLTDRSGSTFARVRMTGGRA